MLPDGVFTVKISSAGDSTERLTGSWTHWQAVAAADSNADSADSAERKVNEVTVDVVQKH